MALPIKEQIIQVMVRDLAAVPWVKNVQRIGHKGVAFAEVPFVIVAQGDDALHRDQTRPHTTRQLDVVVSVITRQTDPDETRSIDEILNGYGADVEAALMQNRKVDELALEVKAPEWFEMEIESKIPHVGIALRFTVVYRHQQADPYRQE